MYVLRWSRPYGAERGDVVEGQGSSRELTRSHQPQSICLRTPLRPHRPSTASRPSEEIAAPASHGTPSTKVSEAMRRMGGVARSGRTRGRVGAARAVARVASTCRRAGLRRQGHDDRKMRKDIDKPERGWKRRKGKDEVSATVGQSEASRGRRCAGRRGGCGAIIQCRQDGSQHDGSD